MRGHVRKRGKTWAVVYDEGYDEGGKRRQRWRGGFATKREAESALSDVLTKIPRGEYVAPSKVTLGEFLADEWLPTRASKVRPSSFTTYDSLVRKQIIPNLGAHRLQALTPGHINVFYAELERVGLSAETRRLIHSILSKALGDAVNWDKITRNPILRVDRPAASERRAAVWTAKELSRFLGHVADDRLFALWRLAATTGMRRGELLGLTWRSLDLEGGRLEVAQQLLPTGRFGPPKSKKSERTVSLDSETVEALKRHRDAQAVEKAFADDAYTDNDLVFCNELGEIIPPHSLSGRFLTQRKAAKVLVGTMHTLRHTAATLMLSNGVPVHVAAARLGDRPETILKTYAHLLPQSDEQAALGIAQLLGAAR